MKLPVYVAICLIVIIVSVEKDCSSLVACASSTVRSELLPTKHSKDLSDAVVDTSDHPSLNLSSSLRPIFTSSASNETAISRLPVQNNKSRVNSSACLDAVLQTGVGGDTDHTHSYQRRCPQVIIIGAKKAGTRALLEFLRVHPDVRAVGPEVHFFDKNYHRGFKWYRRQMPMTSYGQLTVEKTPSYLIATNVPRRVRRMSTEVRLIVVLRDPVTRAVSDYTQTSIKRRRTMPTFEQLAFIDFGNATNMTTVNTSWRAIQIGLYSIHVRRWLTEFSADKLHFVSGERLIADPASVLADVQDFLGLRRVVTDKHFHFSREKGFHCVIRDPQGASHDVHCLGKTKGRKHPVIDTSALKRLRDFFRPHNEDLYRLTNINFSWP